VKYCLECAAPLVPTFLEGKERLRCATCGWTHWEDPKLAVAVLVSDGDRVLLGRRAHDPGRGLWSFPAGFVDRGEQVETAARREVREETGLVVELGPLLALRSTENDPVVLAVYTGKVVRGRAETSAETVELGWFGEGETPPLAFAHDEEILAKWRSNHRSASQ